MLEAYVFTFGLVVGGAVAGLWLFCSFMIHRGNIVNGIGQMIERLKREGKL